MGVEKDQRLANQITVAEFAEVTFAAVALWRAGRCLEVQSSLGSSTHSKA